MYIYIYIYIFEQVEKVLHDRGQEAQLQVKNKQKNAWSL